MKLQQYKTYLTNNNRIMIPFDKNADNWYCFVTNSEEKSTNFATYFYTINGICLGLPHLNTKKLLFTYDTAYQNNLRAIKCMRKIYKKYKISDIKNKICFNIDIIETIDKNKSKIIQDLEKEIKNFKDLMLQKENSDNFYYSSGRYREDCIKLRQLEDKLGELNE